MIDYGTALSLLRQAGAAATMATETVPLLASVGRVSAVPAHSAITVPAFARSMRDGFALDHRLTVGASAAHPLTFPVADTIAAGDDTTRFAQASLAGHVFEIMTGADLPEGCDSVVQVEDVAVQRGNTGQAITVRLDRSLAEGQWVHRVGEDYRPGQLVLAAGQRIAPAHVMALATTGISRIDVRRVPKVALIATGQELVELPAGADVPALRRGQIFNSSMPYLLALLGEAGIDAEYLGPTGDDTDRFTGFLRQRSEAEVVISTGAVSMGRRDFVPDMLRAEGADILFHRVAVKPGKPVLFARLADGRFFLGLPGNQVSSAVGLRFFVAPLLRAMLGLVPETGQAARLATNDAGNPQLCRFLKARLTVDENGQRHVAILDGQESSKASSLATMNAWLVLPPSPALLPGSTVSCHSPALFGEFA